MIGSVQQCIGNNISENVQVIISRKVGKGKEDALILTSGKDKRAECHTWIWWETSENRVATVYSSVGGGNSIFRKNGVKLIRNQNGLTRPRAPRFVEIKSVFLAGTSAPICGPALFRIKYRHFGIDFFVGKSLTLGRWLSRPKKS